MSYAMSMQVTLYYGMTLDVDVAKLIRDARRAAGLSQVALAERLATTQSAISRWERGHEEPRISTLQSILAACGQTLVVSSRPSKWGDVDRAQIRQQLAMTPEARLASVTNVSAFVGQARRVG